MPKVPIVGKVNVLEQAENVAADAWESTRKTVKDTAKTVARDVSAQASFSTWLGLEETLSDEAVKAKEDEEFLRKLDGYKEIFRKIDAIEGRLTDEKVLDEKVRGYIKEERKRATESFREMKTEHKSQASQLGAPQGEQQKPQPMRPSTPTDSSGEPEQPQNASGPHIPQTPELPTLEDISPQGKEAGPSLHKPKKRLHHPRRGTPRATAKLRSSETRAGQGVGG